MLERISDNTKLKILRTASALALSSSLVFGGFLVNNSIKQYEVNENISEPYRREFSIATQMHTMKIPTPSYVIYNEIEKSRTWTEGVNHDDFLGVRNPYGKWVDINPPIYPTRKEKDTKWEEMLTSGNPRTEIQSINILEDDSNLREKVIQRHKTLPNNLAESAFYHVRFKRNAWNCFLNLSGASVSLFGAVLALGYSLPYMDSSKYRGRRILG